METYKMEMGRNGLLGYLLFFHVILIIFHTIDGSVASRGDTLFLGDSLTGKQTIISMNGMFELGFFSTNGSNNWYIGIWYAEVPEKTKVWVANRETPARDRPGILKLSREGHLGLFDAKGGSVWSVNVSKKASKAVILDSGNFLMVADENISDPLWESFDHPVDTWLPGMRFGGQQKLVSWKNSLDPAPGLFSFHMDPSGVKQFVLTWNNSVQYWRSGTWNGEIFREIPEMGNKGFYNISVERVGSFLYMTYSPIHPIFKVSRFVLVNSGAIQEYNLIEGSKWNMFWSKPRDQCAVYGLCGVYGTCDSNNLTFCTCAEGFKPKDDLSWRSREWWSSGCFRQSPLSCDAENESTDQFFESNVMLPDDNYSFSLPAPTKKDCEKACLRNCSCTAFTFNPPSWACKIWSGDLLNMYSFPSQSNTNVSIRVAASALLKFHRQSSSEGKTTRIVGAMLGTIGALAVVLGIFSIVMWRKHRLRSTERYGDSSNSFLRMFSYKELKIATRNFSSKLGSGGFGSVFKGTLTDGTLVAVKKMEGSSQDEKQFRAEISSLGNVQHVNLVRLRGFCAEGSRRLLIYDFMPNGSLDSLLFTSDSKTERKVLDWKTRFEIVLGTARGLLYLHEECRDCIIHSDVKPGNILLDSNLSPKIADFGLAKLVGRGFSHVLITTRGTRGYLAPEWISGLPITPKVDVYSFGMTLFEIISGRRNLELNVQDSSKYYFPVWAATQINQGKTINIVEEGVAEEADIEEVRRASIVGLLCIEEDEYMRPNMGQVVRMLEGKLEPRTLQIQKSLPEEEQAEQSQTSTDSGGNGIS
ncbi:G-type lectin S-receptor-like serine/threonine-protein kinase At2g19130 [Cryptomeria japonica]|uniref:G-type lectin S-receptor-like serine/threonine-protein kinase At2g19130 n=1 Tax=Cryptomeria japonica TaxID=3369 RepID=UPI0027D9F6D5|nr:G-type lectin S-receptor-like serine/threonine-protein kinase At2g19130 [Cryptomeria japonica]